MQEKGQKYIRYTQYIIDNLCNGDSRVLEKYGSRIQWALPFQKGYSRSITQLKDVLHYLSKNITDVTHWNYHAALLENDNSVVSGDFTAHIKDETNSYREHGYHVHMVYLAAKPVCLEITQCNSRGRKLELHNLERESCFVWEDEIIYIEAQREHLFWKSRLGMIETTGVLFKVETELSDFFVRIHRSYIVNKFHVRNIRRFEVKMDNGEVLQIPVRKYQEVKSKLELHSPFQK